MGKILDTDRLLLRQFTTDDTLFIIELLNTEGWLKYIGDRNIKTTEQAIAYLQNGPLKSYAANGYGLCMVELKDGTPIGMCGIINRPTLENPDIGFAFLPAYMGKGYGFEIAGATLKYAKDVLKLPAISAITVPYNEPSVKLLKKIGLKFIKLFRFPGEEEELMLFSN